MGDYDLVLSGGGARGLFQVRAMRVLTDAGYTFPKITGTSTGALQAAGHAVGGMALLEELWGFGTKERPYIKQDAAYKKYAPWQIAVRYLQHKKGIYDFEPLHKLILQELGPGPYPGAWVGVVDVEGDGSFACVEATAETVLASASMPVYAAPVQGFGDGGIRHVTPLGWAIDHGAERIVAILCQPPKLKDCGKLDDFVDVGLRSLEIAVNQLAENDVVSTLEKNEMMEVAAAAGLQLVSPSGKPYRYVPVSPIIRPKAELPGSVLGFKPVDFDGIAAAGIAAAKEALAGLNQPKVLSARAV